MIKKQILIRYRLKNPYVSILFKVLEVSRKTRKILKFDKTVFILNNNRILI